MAVQGRLPVERVTTARGLVHDRITHITADSRGFLWFGTRDGVSRYDGQRFASYTTDDGLPGRFVTTLIEARNGAMYIATVNGLARLDPGAARGKKLFTVIGKDIAINDIVQDRDGRLWAACGESLCEVRGNALERVTSYSGPTIQVLAADRSGQLWAGTANGLLVRRTNGTWDRYAVQPHRDGDTVHGLSIDPRGRLWIGTGFGVLVAEPGKLRSPLIDHAPFTRLTTPEAAVILCRTAVHTHEATWVPTSAGVARFDANGFQLLGERAGLASGSANAVAEDAAGNLWIGADRGGALRIARSGVTTYLRGRVNSIVERDGALCATTDGTRFLECLDGSTVEIIPSSVKFRGWGWGNVAARDRNGEWWVATGQGAMRRSADLKRIVAMYDTSDGLGGDDVFRIWADSRGDVWFSTFGKRVLTRRDTATGKFITYGESDGLPLVAPTAFAEDRAGNLWFGLYTGGVIRFDGRRFTRFDDVPKGFIQDLLFDSRGRLWVAANEGVGPRGGPFRTPGAYSLSERRDGRMIIGTTRGFELLDPDTGRSTRFTTADGLPQNDVILTHVDRDGALWLGTDGGLSRLTSVAKTTTTPPPPRPRIDSIDGKAVPELGAHDVRGLRLEYPDHRMTIAFSAPDFDPRNPLQFEYRLTGDAGWTPAGTRRSVTYERLPFGEQRFEVRAVGGRESASVSMNVIPPLWRRWWFLALLGALVVALGLLLHRMRVAHLLAIQEMRMRVATDLHDDLGSSLSRISILSEVAKRGNERVLDEIGDTARGLVDALGDSIWSIDPRRDDLQSVLARVRHFAADVLEAKSIAMDFDVPPSIAALQLTPEKRRELFLILKEAINNAAKHSGASRLAVAAHVEGSRLRVRVEDDGAGFARDLANGGHGLPSMTARAERAGGSLVIGSARGAGTRIDVVIPMT